MYKFYFRYNYNNEEKLVEFPLAPENLSTRINGSNKTIDTIGLGEVNIIKDVGLRDLEFKIFLPRDISYFGEVSADIKKSYEPIKYLNYFREIMEKKCIVTLIIERILPDGSRIFNGNMKVSLESYCVDENAGEEGSFWVDIKIKEYRDANAVVYETTGQSNNDGQAVAVEINQRQSKEPAKSYVVKNGDSLWKIAKMQLNDGSRYKEIATLNDISNPDKIFAGMTLILP